MSVNNYLSDVREQYEHLPYPGRDPEDEKERLLETNLDFLPRLNHYCFAGKRDFNQEFKVLVAGGGTGDAVIYLAEQLRNTPAQITYIDITTRSMEIAQQRAQVRKLDNIKWLHASILDLTHDTFGTFDYINCSGVLHHLSDPLAGLQRLKSVMAENGAMGIMVYAKYGRTAVYQMQDLMQLINNADTSIPDKIDNAWLALESLPESNWWKRSEELHKDHIKYGDIGLFDLLLHSQDRAYSIPELYEWLQAANLEFVSFSGNKLDYDPRNYIQNRKLASIVSQKPEPVQQAIAELVSGTISKHSFYCSRKSDVIAHLDEDMIPIFADPSLRKDIIEQMKPGHYGDSYVFRKQKVKFTLPINKLYETLFKYFDGTSTFQVIVDKTMKEMKLEQHQQHELVEMLKSVCDLFIAFDEMYLSKYDYSFID